MHAAWTFQAALFGVWELCPWTGQPLERREPQVLNGFVKAGPEELTLFEAAQSGNLSELLRLVDKPHDPNLVRHMGRGEASLMSRSNLDNCR